MIVKFYVIKIIFYNFKSIVQPLKTNHVIYRNVYDIEFDSLIMYI